MRAASRQPPHRKEGPVKAGQLAIAHEGNTRIVEAALPWSEIPHVKGRVASGRTVTFSFCVSQNSRGPTWNWPETARSPSRTARRSIPTGPSIGPMNWSLRLRSSRAYTIHFQ